MACLELAEKMMSKISYIFISLLVGFCLPSCFPVSTVFGRSAHVATEDYGIQGYGGVYGSLTEVGDDESNFFLPIFHFREIAPINPRMDLSFGVTGTQFLAATRFLITPNTSPHAGAISCDIGGSIIIPPIGNAIFSDIMFCINASPPSQKHTPYISYAFYLVNIANGDNGDRAFRQQVACMGIELQDIKDKSLAIEVTYSWPYEYSDKLNHKNWQTWGVNVLWGQGF